MKHDFRFGGGKLITPGGSSCPDAPFGHSTISHEGGDDSSDRRPVPYLRRGPDVSVDQLRELYVTQHRTVRELAVLLGISRTRVMAELQSAGIALRSAAIAPPVDARTLARCYRQFGGSLTKVARHLGVDHHTARTWLIEAGEIEVTASVDLGKLRELYVDQRVSLKQTAKRLAVSPARVRDSLLAAGIPIRDRFHRTPTPAQAGVTDDVLRELYVGVGLSIAEVADKLGASRWYVGRRIAETGLRKRPGTHTPHLKLDPVMLTERAAALYQQGHSMHHVAAELGVGTDKISRLLNEAGVPIRPAGFPHLTQGVPSRHLIADLYADANIRAILRRHNVLIPASDEWRKTSPHETRSPLPPPAELLRELYVEVGLTAYHIALLCGVGDGYISGHLAKHDVPRRPPHQPSPWIARHYGLGKAKIKGQQRNSRLRGAQSS